MTLYNADCLDILRTNVRLFNSKNVTVHFNGDSGTVSRYFTQFHYFNKANPSERNEGLNGMEKRPQNSDGNIRTYNDRCGNCGKKFTGDENSRCQCPPGEKVTDKTVYTNENFHPTVKGIPLMIWLCRLITPPNGIVLDPFMGSGSTGVAAVQLGFDFIGIEKEREYFEIAEKRIGYAKEPQGQMALF